MKKYILLSLVITTAFIWGCKESLDLYPMDTISDATFWKTATDYKLAANNLYRSLEDFNYGSGDYYYNMDTETDIAFDVPNSISNGTYQTLQQYSGKSC